jgi:hypothetical protein
MKFVATATLCVAGALLPSLSQAQIYMCKDASGHTITSDRPIPECSDRTIREYGKSGNFKRNIPPPPTAEERRKQQEEEDRKKAEEAAAKDQKRADSALIARYRSEIDIDNARKRSLAIVQEQQKRENASLAKAEEQLKQAQTEVDANRKKKTPVPPVLARKVDDLQSGVNASKKRIQDQDAELAKINAKYDDETKRFKELTSASHAR